MAEFARSEKLADFLVELPGNMMEALRVLTEEWKTKTQTNLAGSTTGIYPARRTGYLHSQVLPNGPQVKQISADTYRSELIVDTPYAYIQNYGGTAGRFHSSVIPPRPYASDAAMSMWQNVIKTAGDIIFEPLRR